MIFETLFAKFAESSSTTKILGTTAILGVVASFWNKFILIINKLKAIFIVGFTIKITNKWGFEKSAIVYYLRNHYKVIGTQKFEFLSYRCFRKDRNKRMTFCPFLSYMPLNDFILFVKKWSIVFLNSNVGQDNTTMTIWTFRFMIDPKKFYEDAINEWDDYIHKDKTNNNIFRRFKIFFRSGYRGENTQDKVESCADPGATPYNEDSNSMQAELIPLGFNWEDVSFDNTGAKEVYALNDELENAYKEVKFWLKSKNWYFERGIPWKRGWLLTGSPGVGKTAFIRWLAKNLDLPVIIFDLSTFNNNDFTHAWQSVCDYSPCIVLIEDIDAIYCGRKNITDTEMNKGVTFDKFINCIDGLQRNDGVFTIITSNHPENIDSAIGTSNGDMSSRPGRIDKIIEIKPLNQNQKNQIAQNILCGFESYIPSVIEKGYHDNGAQFVERCRNLAEQLYWEFTYKTEENDIEKTKIVA